MIKIYFDIISAIIFLLEYSRILFYINTPDFVIKTYITTKMLDWEGLLKFTLKYSDGTNQSEFK